MRQQQLREHHTDRPITVGVFSTVRCADIAVEGLLAAGYPHESISVLSSDRTVEEHYGELVHEEPAGTHTPATAAAGSTIGATLGGFAALAGILATGGVGLLVAGSMLSGAAATGALAGGLIGAMMSRGVEKELADYYDQALTKGKILVAVATEDAPGKGRAEAERILASAGADPIELPRE